MIKMQSGIAAMGVLSVLLWSCALDREPRPEVGYVVAIGIDGLSPDQYVLPAVVSSIDPGIARQIIPADQLYINPVP